MTHEDLDLMTDVVEETTAYLKEKGLIPTERAEFLVSRFIEFGIRGKTVEGCLRIMGKKRNEIGWDVKKYRIPAPTILLELGTAVFVARACKQQGRKMVNVARRLGAPITRTGNRMDRCFGVRYRGLKEKTWQELVDVFLERRWPGWGERNVA